MGPIQRLTVHLFLTDRLSCPRCGPAFGLILLAHEVRNRIVSEGDLGCSNCREKFPIRGGRADLRMPPRGPLPEAPRESGEEVEDSQEAIRLAALMGVAQGPGTLLIKGPATMHAGEVSRLIEGIEVVALGPTPGGAEETESVSRVVSDRRIPFLSNSFRGMVLSGEVTDLDWEEAARVVAPSGRIVALQTSAQTRKRVELLGLKVLLQEEGVLVVLKEGSGSLPLVTLRGS